MKKNKVMLYLCTAIFGMVGIYLTFVSGNVSKYDSQVRAYQIYVDEDYDSDDGTMYSPVYYFTVDGVNYKCSSKTSSSTYPSENKNTVYYDSKNPNNCKTEYDRSSGRFIGIICLVVTAIIIYFFIIKKPASNANAELNDNDNLSASDYQVNGETVEKISRVLGKVSLIFKRIILGIIFIVLLILVLFDTALFKQTIKSKDYIDTIAMYSYKKETSDGYIFDDYIYTFEDTKGKVQEITIGISKDEGAPDTIKIMYDENNPQEFYQEGNILSKSGIIWYFVKILLLIGVIVLFFSKRALNKISISVSH